MAPRDAASSHPQSNPVLSLPTPESLQALPTATTPPRPTAPRQAPPASTLASVQPVLHTENKGIFSKHTALITANAYVQAHTETHAQTRTHMHAPAHNLPMLFQGVKPKFFTWTQDWPPPSLHPHPLPTAPSSQLLGPRAPPTARLLHVLPPPAGTHVPYCKPSRRLGPLPQGTLTL